MRSALHTHGVTVYSEDGELKVMEPELATSGTPSLRAPSLLGSQYSIGGGIGGVTRQHVEARAVDGLASRVGPQDELHLGRLELGVDLGPTLAPTLTLTRTLTRTHEG